MRLNHGNITTIRSWIDAVDRFFAACYNLDAYFRLHFNVVVSSSREEKMLVFEVVLGLPTPLISLPDAYDHSYPLP
jgi:hypothetical protein